MAKRGFTGAMMQAFGARDHIATVPQTQQLTPHVVRVHFHSDTLFNEAETGPTAWLRFWFPGPDDKEFQRAYTLSETDESAGTFAIDMVLHEPSGPASTWAQHVDVGMTLAVASLGSRRFEVPEELPAGYLLVGDSASLPGINGILAAVPAEVPVEIYLEEHDPHDQALPLIQHPRVRVHWVPRRNSHSLAAALEDRDWSNWYAWLAPEVNSLKALRIRLRDDFGFPKTEIYAQAYWAEGKEMGKSRDPEPVAATAQQPAEELTTAAAPVPAAPQGQWRAQAGNRLLAPLKPSLIIAGFLQGLITLLQLAPFVVLLELARQLLSGAPAARLWALGIWSVALIGAGAVLAAGLICWLHIVDARFAKALRQRLLTKLGSIPLSWFDRRGSGHLKQLVHDDTLALHYLVTHAVPDAVGAAVAPIAVLTYLLVVDWRLALLLFVPVLVYIVTMWIMLVRSGAKTADSQRWVERMTAAATGYLAGQPAVRIFGGAAASTFRTRLREYIDFLGDWQRPFTRQKTVMDLATRPSTFLVLIVVFGTLFITVGSTDPVTLLPFLFLGTTFGARLLGVGYGLGGLRTGLLAARRIQVALDEPELVTLPAAVAAEPVPPGQVSFRDVSFSYTSGVPALRDLNLSLAPGTVTALVGSSGSGKSTLAALLARFHDVDTGAIHIGGRDLRTLEPDELYQSVGFVFQHTQLVHGTVRENIALSIPDAPFDDVVAAAEAAQIHQRILTMPNGYETVLGPDPALSGGERQRVAIARALLANTPVLVLDEATAFADPESEFLVQQALNELMHGRTVLVIAHRLTTVTEVDQIVVLDHGRIVQTGTHEQLLAVAGRYRDLWTAHTTTQTENAR